MSTTAKPRGPWGKWLNFWFAPVDPTTLGFIRLVTGFAVLYVHLAYCFDLNAFFGENGWYGLTYSNRERQEAPTQIGEFSGPNAWNEVMQGARVPEFPHRRAAVMEWIRSLPPEQEKLEPKLAFLERVAQRPNPGEAQEGLAYVMLLSGDPEIRERQLSEIKDGVRRVTGPPIQGFFKTYPDDGPTGRPALIKEIDTFFRSLPADEENRKFVVSHLIEMDPVARGQFVQFLRDLTAVTAEERAERIEYLEYWGSEERFAYRLGAPLFSLWFHITDPTGMAIAHGVVIVIIFLFAIGFCTRVTSILTWLAVISYIHRTQQVLFGMDTMMNILLIYLMIGNSGAALSVDRLIARYRAARNSLARTGTIDAATQRFLEKPPESVSAGFAIRLLQVHFCFIYMAAGMSKLKGDAWWNTMAYWDTLVNPEFTLIHYRWYEFLVREMVQERPVFALASAFGVGFTFIAEFGLPFLVWTKLRPYMVMIGCMLHAGVALFMGLWIFSLLMMTMLLGYIPGCCIRERIFGSGTKSRVGYRFDRSDPAQVRSAAFARALDFDAQIDFSENPEVRVTADGQEEQGPAAAKVLVRQLSWAKPLGWLLAIPLVGGLLSRKLVAVSDGGGYSLPKPKSAVR